MMIRALVPLVCLLVLGGCASGVGASGCTNGVCGTCLTCCEVPPMVEVQTIPVSAAYEPPRMEVVPDCSARAVSISRAVYVPACGPCANGQCPPVR